MIEPTDANLRLRAHGQRKHDDTPDPECRACQRFDPRINREMHTPEWAHREGLHEYGDPSDDCSLCTQKQGPA